MKKIILLLTIIGLGLTLTACSHIEDENGDDTTLATFTLADKIENKSFSSTSSVSSTVYSGGTTYSFSYEEIDYDHISMTVGKLSGVSKIHVSDMNADESLELTITSSLESGNLEIVIIDPNNNIIETIVINETVTITINPTIEGEYFVVVGGESAEYNITIDREIN